MARKPADTAGAARASADTAPLPPSPLEQWPPRWAPEAVVFDCDGLLVDTEGRWVALQEDYLARHGAPQRGDDGVHLVGDVDAVAPGLDHLLQPPHLPLDAAQPGKLPLVVDRDAPVPFLRTAHRHPTRCRKENARPANRA